MILVHLCTTKYFSIRISVQFDDCVSTSAGSQASSNCLLATFNYQVTGSYIYLCAFSQPLICRGLYSQYSQVLIVYHTKVSQHVKCKIICAHVMTPLCLLPYINHFSSISLNIYIPNVAFPTGLNLL